MLSVRYQMRSLLLSPFPTGPGGNNFRPDKHLSLAVLLRCLPSMLLHLLIRQGPTKHVSPSTVLSQSQEI